MADETTGQRKLYIAGFLGEVELKEAAESNGLPMPEGKVFRPFEQLFFEREEDRDRCIAFWKEKAVEMGTADMVTLIKVEYPVA